MDHPNDWFLQESLALSRTLQDQKRNFVQVSIDNEHSTRQGEEGSPCQPGYAGITFQIGKLRQENFESFKGFVDFLIENPERGLPPSEKLELIQATVGGRNALMIADEAYENCESGFYYVEQSPDRYTTISFIAGKNEDKRTIDQILSTFRFVEVDTGELSITLLSPSGGETWPIGSRHTITWESRGVGKVRIAPAVGGKGLATSEEIDASLGAYENFVVPDMAGFGIEPPYEVSIMVFDAENPDVSDRATFTATE